MTVPFPREWAETDINGDLAWWEETRLVDVDTDSCEALSLAAHFARNSLKATLQRVQRVQKRRLWEEFRRHRDGYVAVRSQGWNANERFLFHGTGPRCAAEVLAHPDGLDPRLSLGGCFGRGVYLAEEPAYLIWGQRAHRLLGYGGRRLQLLVVRAALGTPQSLGPCGDATTEAMTMPGVRLVGPPRVLFGSVRAGPACHALDSCAPVGLPETSVIYVCYDARQMYPAYVIDFEIELAPVLTPSLDCPGLTPRQSCRATLSSVIRDCTRPGSSLSVSFDDDGEGWCPERPVIRPLEQRPCGPPEGSACGIEISVGRVKLQCVPSLGLGNMSLQEGWQDNKIEVPPFESDMMLPAEHFFIGTPRDDHRLAILLGNSRCTGQSKLGMLVEEPMPSSPVSTVSTADFFSDSDCELDRSPLAGGSSVGQWSPCHSSPHGSPSEIPSPCGDMLAALAEAASIASEPPPAADCRRLNPSPARSRGDMDSEPATSAPSSAVAALVAVLSDTSLGRQSLAASAIQDLAAQSTEARAALIAAGAAPPLVAMLQGSPCCRLRAAGALRNLAARCCPESAPVFSAAGAVPALVSLLREGCPEARRHAAGALSNLCGSMRCKVSIVAAGAVPLLAAAIRVDTLEGKTLAAAALQNLAAGCDLECCATFVASGSVPPLVALLREELIEVRVLAAAALQNIAAAAEAEARATIVSAGAIPMLVGMMHDHYLEGKTRAAGLLQNLAIGSAKHKADIVAAGAIPPLVDMLRADANLSPEARSLAAGALRNVVAKGDADHLAAIVAVGAIPPLVAMLRAGAESTPRGKVEAAAVLQNLALADSGRKAAIAAAGGIHPLVAMLSGSAGIEGQSCAAGALLNLAMGNSRRKASIVAAGAIPPLVSVLRHGSTEGRALAAGALRNLAAKGDSERIAAVAAAGAVPSLLAILRDGSLAGKAHAAAVLKRLADESAGCADVAKQIGYSQLRGDDLEAMLEELSELSEKHELVQSPRDCALLSASQSLNHTLS